MVKRIFYSIFISFFSCTSNYQPTETTIEKEVGTIKDVSIFEARFNHHIQLLSLKHSIEETVLIDITLEYLKNFNSIEYNLINWDENVELKTTMLNDNNLKDIVGNLAIKHQLEKDLISNILYDYIILNKVLKLSSN